MELTFDSALSPAAFPGHASYFLVVLAMLMSSILALRLLALDAAFNANLRHKLTTANRSAMGNATPA